MSFLKCLPRLSTINNYDKIIQTTIKSNIFNSILRNHHTNHLTCGSIRFYSTNNNNNNNNKNNSDNNRNEQKSITSNKISPISPKEFIKISKESIAAKQRLSVDSNIEQQLKDDPDAFFSNRSNHQRYFKWLANKLRYKIPTDWYKAKRKDIIQYYGKSILEKYYKGDHIKAIIENNPDSKLQPWHFPTLTRQYWNDNTRREYTMWLAKHVGRGEKPNDDWHYLRSNDFLHNSGNHIIGYYETVPNALLSLFPEFQWKPWLFEKLPVGYFRDRENARKYLYWLSPILNIQQPSDWYRLTQKDFRMNQGFHLMKIHNTTPAKVIMNVLGNKFKIPKNSQNNNNSNNVDVEQPEEQPKEEVDEEINFEWQSWRFVVIKNKKCNIDYLEDMINYLRKQGKEITMENIEAIEGKSILDHFGGDIDKALKVLENKEEYIASTTPSPIKKEKPDEPGSFEDQYEFIQDEFDLEDDIDEFEDIEDIIKKDKNQQQQRTKQSSSSSKKK